MSINPAKIDFTIWRGTTFRKTLTLLTGAVGAVPQSLVNYSAEMIIRNRAGEVPMFTLTTINNRISLSTLGIIELFISAADTTSIDWRRGVYDLTITAPNDGDTDALLYGAVQVKGI
jgi:hypothetical protein